MLDTDSFVFMVRGMKPGAKPAIHARALRIIKKCQSAKQAGDKIAVSAIMLSELEFGAQCGPDYDDEMTTIRQILTPFETFDFDSASCPKSYGKVKYELRTAGTPIGALDELLAAHALALDATMVTNNTADFQRVKGLRVVNWS